MTELDNIGFESGINDPVTDHAGRNDKEFAMKVANYYVWDDVNEVAISKPRRLGIRIRTTDNVDITETLEVVPAALAEEYFKEVSVETIPETPTGETEQIVCNMKVASDRSSGRISYIELRNPAGDISEVWPRGKFGQVRDVFPYQQGIRTTNNPYYGRFDPRALEADKGYNHYHFRPDIVEVLAKFNILKHPWTFTNNGTSYSPELVETSEARYGFLLIFIRFKDENGEFVEDTTLGEGSYNGWWLALDLTKSISHINADLMAQARLIHPTLNFKLSPYEGSSYQLNAFVPAYCELIMPELIPPASSREGRAAIAERSFYGEAGVADNRVINYLRNGFKITADSSGLNTETSLEAAAESPYFLANFMEIPSTADEVIPVIFPQGVGETDLEVDVTINPARYFYNEDDPTEIGAYLEIELPKGNWNIESADWYYQFLDGEVEEYGEFPAYLFRRWISSDEYYWTEGKTIWWGEDEPGILRAENDNPSLTTITQPNDLPTVVGRLKVAPPTNSGSYLPKRISPFNGHPTMPGILRIRFKKSTGITLDAIIAFKPFDYEDAYQSLINYQNLEKNTFPTSLVGGVNSPLNFTFVENTDVVIFGETKTIPLYQADVNLMMPMEVDIPLGVVEIPQETVAKITTYADDTTGLKSIYCRINIQGRDFELELAELTEIIAGNLQPDGSSYLALYGSGIGFLPYTPDVFVLGLFIGFRDETIIDIAEAYMAVTFNILPLTGDSGNPQNATVALPLEINDIFNCIDAQGPDFELQISIWHPSAEVYDADDDVYSYHSAAVSKLVVTTPAELVALPGKFPDINVFFTYDDATDKFTITEVIGEPVYLDFIYRDATLLAEPDFGSIWGQSGDAVVREATGVGDEFVDVPVKHFGATLPFVSGDIFTQTPELTAKLVLAPTDLIAVLAAEDQSISVDDFTVGTWTPAVTHDGLTPLEVGDSVSIKTKAVMTLTHPLEIPMGRFDLAVSYPTMPSARIVDRLAYPLAIEITDSDFLTAIIDSKANNPGAVIGTVYLSNLVAEIKNSYVTVSPDELTATVAFKGFSDYRFDVDYVVKADVNFDALIPNKWKNWGYEVKATAAATDIPETTEVNYLTSMDISSIVATATHISSYNATGITNPSMQWCEIKDYDSNRNGAFLLPDYSSNIDHYDQDKIEFAYTHSNGNYLIETKSGHGRATPTVGTIWLEGATIPPEFDSTGMHLKAVQFEHGVGIFVHLPAYTLPVVDVTPLAVIVTRTSLTRVEVDIGLDTSDYPLESVGGGIGISYAVDATTIEELYNSNELFGSIRTLGTNINFTFYLNGSRALADSIYGPVDGHPSGLIASNLIVPYDGNYRIIVVL